MADTLKQLKCPACGELMEKVFIPSEGINVDICTDGCGGIFFDNRELNLFNEENEDISIILEKLNNKNYKSVDQNLTRNCPCCSTQMIKNNVGIKSDVVVDDCYVCGGKFLDNGELLKIRSEYKNDTQRTNEAMEYIYRKVGRQLSYKDKKFVKSKINRSLGQKLFYSLLGIV